MATKNKVLATATFKVEYKADEDGDVRVKIVETVAIGGMTGNLQEVVDSGLYTTPDEDAFMEPVEAALATRPNRRRD